MSVCACVRPHTVDKTAKAVLTEAIPEGALLSRERAEGTSLSDSESPPSACFYDSSWPGPPGGREPFLLPVPLLQPMECSPMPACPLCFLGMWEKVKWRPRVATLILLVLGSPS